MFYALCKRHSPQGDWWNIFHAPVLAGLESNALAVNQSLVWSSAIRRRVLESNALPTSCPAQFCATWTVPAISPDISCAARNADRPERRLAVGFVAAMPVKAD